MEMNLIIQNRRKALNLTQEQVAKALNVSIPAVSKWESGLTSPDISLLPSLARLLKIDLNTLFSFKEDLSKEDISKVCEEVRNSNDINEAFNLAFSKLKDYPYNEELKLNLTFLLDAKVNMLNLSYEEKEKYSKILVSWYLELSNSGDLRINNSANFMLASRYIKNEEYSRAEEILNLMEDKEEVVRDMADKLMLQVSLYLKQ